MRGRGPVRPGDRLPQRGHGRVPAGPGRQLRLHRDEPADPGRAHGHRGGHRRRPGPGPAADRLRRDPGGPGADPRGHPGARRRPPVPDHHRGPGQQLPPRHRRDHDLPLPRRWWRAPRRRYDVHRCGDLRPLRLDVVQAHLPRPHLRAGRAEGAPRRRGVPDPGRHHQHRVPAGRPGRPRLPGRPDHHQLHRDPPAAPQGAGQRRPRHQADDLPGRRHGQPAARPGPGDPRPRHQAARPRPRRARPRRHPPAAARARAGGVRAAAARAEGRRGHRHHLPGCPPVAVGHPGAEHRPAGGGAVRRAQHPAALVARVLGRRDVRRGAALPLRGPVGAAGRAAAGGPEPLPPDAAARPQHRRLHAVPHRGHHRVRAGGGGDRPGRLPHLRRAQRRRADAPGHRGGPRDRDHRGGGGPLLHRRPLQPG